MQRSLRLDVLLAAALAIGTVLLYVPLREADFINYDDPLYVTANPVVLEGLNLDSLAWAWSWRRESIVVGNWHPVTMTSHLIDVELFGLDAGKHHLASVLWHALNAMLLFVVLRRATGARGPSVVVALFFAIHPFNVDSVAWISERKNLVSTTCWLLGMLAYVRHAHRRARWTYAAVMLCLALGLAAKPMLVTFPFALLLLDWWPLRRAEWKKSDWAPLIREKIPLLVLATAFVVSTLLTQRYLHTNSAGYYPMSVRVFNAIACYGTYVVKTFVPHDFAVFYPHPANEIPWMDVAGGAFVLLAGSALAWICRRSRPYVTVGWLWFAGTLIPVIGIVQVGSQAMADRYAYVPLWGLFVAAVWGVADLIGRPRWAGALAVAVSVWWGWVAWQQMPHWRNSETVFRHAIEVTEGNYFAHTNLGQALDARGLRSEARREFQIAVDLKPQYSIAQLNLGTVALQQNDLEKAAHHLALAVELDAYSAEARANLGALYLKVGNVAESIPLLEQALELNPNLTAARNNLARARRRS